jgi:hypothetical protein
MPAIEGVLTMSFRFQLAGAGLACLLLAGCAAPQSGEDVVALSNACAVDLVYEWDGSKGADTPAAAVRATLTWFEEKSEELRGKDADPANALEPEDDPVLAAITVRGLEALLGEAERIGSTDRQESYDLVATPPNGEQFAFATIAAQPEGGYRVDTLRVQGLVSDHPDC